MRLRSLERRVAKVEQIMMHSNATGHAPAPPSMPPDGAIPRALQRIFDLRVEAHRTSRQLTMLYDFLVLKYPGSVQELERILRVDSLSPSPSDDLYAEDSQAASSGIPPHDVDLMVADTGDHPGDVEASPAEDHCEDSAEEDESPSIHGCPAVTPATPAPKRRRLD